MDVCDFSIHCTCTWHTFKISLNVLREIGRQRIDLVRVGVIWSHECFCVSLWIYLYTRLTNFKLNNFSFYLKWEESDIFLSKNIVYWIYEIYNIFGDKWKLKPKLIYVSLDRFVLIDFIDRARFRHIRTGFGLSGSTNDSIRKSHSIFISSLKGI